MVGCLESIGRGEFDKEVVSTWLKARDRRTVLAKMAPPHGSYIKKLVYNEKYVQWTHLDHEYADKQSGVNNSSKGIKGESGSQVVEEVKEESDSPARKEENSNEEVKDNEPDEVMMDDFSIGKEASSESKES